MAKRLAVLAAVLATAMLAAAPAVAQEGYQYGGDDTATLSFELAVEGQPPADARFLGRSRRKAASPRGSPTRTASASTARPRPPARAPAGGGLLARRPVR